MAEEKRANAEWRLSDFLDVLAAEVDRSQDTLSLKSFGRGMTVAVQGLSLDLAVNVRVDEKGQVFFRSAEAGQPAATVLKVDLREVFQSQLEEVRRPLDDDGLGLPLSSLPEITAPEIESLHTLSVFTVDDLRRLCRTPALLSEVSRKTGIPETSLRRWLGLPFLTRIVPPSGSPGQSVVIEGGNLGEQDTEDTVLFQETVARILAWEETRITVEVPAGAVSGPVLAHIDGARSNVLAWQAQTTVPIDPPPPPPAADLAVTSLIPDRGRAGIIVTVTVLGKGFQPGVTASLGRGVTVHLDRTSSERLAMNVTLPPRVRGARALTVTNPDGTTVTVPDAFQILAPEA